MESTECGAACLGMILAYHGRRMSLEQLRVLCGVSRDGSKAARMLRAARECGLIAGGFHSEPHQLFDLPFPLIVFWNFDHFIVVEGIRKDRVWVVDPASGPRRMSLQEFDRGFTGVCLAFAPGPEWRPGGRAPGAVRGLASRLGRTRSALWFALLATVALAVPGLAVATLIRVFIDSVLIPGDGAWVVPVLLGLALAAVVQAGLTWLQQTCLARIEIRLSVVMVTRFLEHVVSLPMAFFGQRFIGDITARIGSNDRVARLLSGELVGSAMGLLTMVLYAAAMLSYDAGLTLIVFVLALANLAALRGVSRTRENATRLMLKERGKVDGVALNGLGMIETIKAGGEEGQFFSRWSGLYANALAARQDLTRVTGLLNVVPPFLLSLGTVVILGVGGLRVLDGGLSLGGLVAFLTLTTSFLAPVNRLMGLGASLQTVRGNTFTNRRAAEYRRASASAPGRPSRRPYPTSRRTTAPFFCSTQAWSFFRYGLDRVSSMPCSLQKPINTSLRNSLPLSVSIPRNGNGRAPRSRSTASTTTPASRTSSGTHSVQPLAISVSTSVQTKLPAIDDPQCATRSASTKPGAGSCQSPNVRTATLPRTGSPPARRRRR